VYNIFDIINICSYYAICDCNNKVEVDSLVGMGFARYFVMRSLKMQLCLLRSVLVDWLIIFCMARVMYRRGAISWRRYRNLLPMSGMKRKSYCIVRKGEKQIQILDGY
jgi:hypothetical protein